jgi:hypothetical protein
MANEHGPTTNPTEIIDKVFTPAPINAEWIVRDNGAEVEAKFSGSAVRQEELNLARKRIADRAVAIAFAPDEATQAAMAAQQVEIVQSEIAQVSGLEVQAIGEHEMTQVVASVVELNVDLIREQLDGVMEDKVKAERLENERLRAELARRDAEIQSFRALVTPDAVMSDAVIRDQKEQIKTLELKLATAEHAAAEHRHEKSEATRMRRIVSEVGQRARQLWDGILVDVDAVAAQADIEKR